jgi:hypothetical protein
MPAGLVALQAKAIGVVRSLARVSAQCALFPAGAAAVALVAKLFGVDFLWLLALNALLLI